MNGVPPREGQAVGERQRRARVTRQVMAKLVITVSPTFFLRTMPP